MPPSDGRTNGPYMVTVVLTDRPLAQHIQAISEEQIARLLFPQSLVKLHWPSEAEALVRTSGHILRDTWYTDASGLNPT
eukprot:5425467-Amphidinium_carterae.1